MKRTSETLGFPLHIRNINEINYREPIFRLSPATSSSNDNPPPTNFKFPHVYISLRRSKPLQSNHNSLEDNEHQLDSNFSKKEK